MAADPIADPLCTTPNELHQTLDALSRRQQERKAAEEAEQARDLQEREAQRIFSAALGKVRDFPTPTLGHAPREGTTFAAHGGEPWDTRTIAPRSDPRWLEWADAYIEAGREIAANGLESRLDNLRTAPEILHGENGHRRSDAETYLITLLRLGCAGDRERLADNLYRASLDHWFVELHPILFRFGELLANWRTEPWVREFTARAERNQGLTSRPEMGEPAAPIDKQETPLAPPLAPPPIKAPPQSMMIEPLSEATDPFHSLCLFGDFIIARAHTMHSPDAVFDRVVWIDENSRLLLELDRRVRRCRESNPPPWMLDRKESIAAVDELEMACRHLMGKVPFRFQWSFIEPFMADACADQLRSLVARVKVLQASLSPLLGHRETQSAAGIDQGFVNVSGGTDADETVIYPTIPEATDTPPIPLVKGQIQGRPKPRQREVKEVALLLPVEPSIEQAMEASEPTKARDEQGLGQLEGIGGLRLHGWLFDELTPSELALLHRLAKQPGCGGEDGRVSFEEAEKAVYKQPKGTKSERKERLDRHRKELNRKLVKQSDGKVFISTKTVNTPQKITFMWVVVTKQAQGTAGGRK